jgi:hypothetical protein
MTLGKRINTFEERMKVKGEEQTATEAQMYRCGCGSHLWFLLNNGDCVCAQCQRAQARIIVSELAPVSSTEGKSGQ